MKKKGQMGLNMVPGTMITLLAIVLVIFFTAKFVGQLQSGENVGNYQPGINGSLAYNATVAGSDTVKNVTSNMPLWGLAIGIGVSIVIILGMLVWVSGRQK